MTGKTRHKPRLLSDEERMLAVSMWDGGKTVFEIARELKTDITTAKKAAKSQESRKQ